MVVAVLKYPKKSHRKAIHLPPECPALAELMGIEFGDGGINNPWQLVISLDSNADREYVQHVCQLLHELFGIDVAVRKRPGQNTVVLVCSSVNLVEFLEEKGAVRGNKLAKGLDVPGWIRGHREYERAFVRGLVDTDGGLYIHRHVTKGIPYRNIGFCFTSYSVDLTASVAEIFRKFNIEPHVSGHGRRIYLYGQRVVSEYLRTFGSSNPRILRLYKAWRGAGAVERARLESG